MTDLSRYQGLHALGSAWEVVFRNDVHAPGFVDWVLMEAMVSLCAETAPIFYDDTHAPAPAYRPGLRAELEEVLTQLTGQVTKSPLETRQTSLLGSESEVIE